MKPPKIDFEVLRQVAETASGYRYRDTWIVVSSNADGFPVITPVHEEPKPDDGIRIFFSEKVDYPEPPPLTEAWIACGKRTVDLLDLRVEPFGAHPGGTFRADAVFWSLSAVEKFVVPYYASVFGDSSGTVVQSLLEVLKPAEGTPLEERAFAIAHLPSSEYAIQAFGDAGDPIELVALTSASHARPLLRR